MRWCPHGIKFQRHSWGLASRSLRGEHEQVVCGRWGWKGFWSPAGAGFSPRGAGLRLMTPPPSPPRILLEAAGETPDAGGERGRLRGREGGSTGDLPAVDAQKCIFPFPFQASQGSSGPISQVVSVTLEDTFPPLYVRCWHRLIYLITTTQ